MTIARTDRFWAILDFVAGAGIAASIGLWLIGYNAAAATNADALYLSTIIQDVYVQGFGVLRSWHYASSSFIFPDVIFFVLTWLVTRRFDSAISGFAASVWTLTFVALWLLFKPRKDASFAVFSAAVGGGGALVAAIACVITTSDVLRGSFYGFSSVSAHHYASCVNELLALAVYLWARRAPTVKRYVTLGLVVFLFVASDLLFLVTFPASVVVGDYWFERGSPIRWLRRHWPVFPALSVPAIAAIALDAAVNPLSPVHGGPALISVLDSLKVFLAVRVEDRWRLTETVIRVVLIIVMVVAAEVLRRKAKTTRDPVIEQISIVLAVLVVGVFCSVFGAVGGRKYMESAHERYVQGFAFFPLFGALGLLGAWVASLTVQRKVVTGLVGAAGLASCVEAESRIDYSSSAPYADCTTALGLDGTAGLAPYWIAKPLVVFTNRRVQAVQIGERGDLYDNLTNTRWAVEDWFGHGTTPNIAFALMAADDYHSRMVDGRSPYRNDDGRVLDPVAIRSRYGVPESVALCNGATFWKFAPRSLAGRGPIPPADLLTFPYHVRADNPQLAHPADVVVQGRQLLSTGKSGRVVFGPYMELPAGAYRARWLGQPLSTDGTLSFDVATGRGDVPGTQRTIALAGLGTSSSELVALDLQLDALTRSVEFRIEASTGARVALDELVIELR